MYFNVIFLQCLSVYVAPAVVHRAFRVQITMTKIEQKMHICSVASRILIGAFRSAIKYTLSAFLKQKRYTLVTVSAVQAIDQWFPNWGAQYLEGPRKVSGRSRRASVDTRGGHER